LISRLNLPSLQDSASTLSSAVDVFAEIARAELDALASAIDATGLVALGGRIGTESGYGGGGGGGTHGAGPLAATHMQSNASSSDASLGMLVDAIDPSATGRVSGADGDTKNNGGAGAPNHASPIPVGIDLVIPRGIKSRVAIDVPQGDSTIVIKVLVHANDIGVELCKVTMSQVNIDGSFVEQADLAPVVAYSRIDASKGVHTITHPAIRAGVYALMLDNSYALVTDKSVRYHVSVDADGDAHLPFFLRKPATHERVKR
jgi:hypothetical protein